MSEQKEAHFCIEAKPIQEIMRNDAAVYIRRKPGKIETPEEAVARRNRINELKRQSKVRKLLRETPEEKAIRKIKAAKHNHEYRQKQRALKIPEKAAEIQLAKEEAAARRAAEIERKRKEKELIETPEVKAARRMQITKQVREHRRKQQALETPDQKAERLAKAAKRMRETRALQALEKRKLKEAQLKNVEAILDTQGESAALSDISRQIQQSSVTQCDEGKLTSTEISTQGTSPSGTDFESPLDGATTKVKLKYVQKKRIVETLGRRARKTELRRMYRAMETPEGAAVRRARNREFMRKYRALETPEQAEERRAQNREKMRFYRNSGVPKEKGQRVASRLENCMNQQGQKIWNEKSGQLMKGLFFNNVNFTTEGFTHEHNRILPKTTQCDTSKHNCIAIKEEQLQDEWSIFECTESSFITHQALQSHTVIDIESPMKGKYQNEKFNEQDSKGNLIQEQMEIITDKDSDIYDYIKMCLAAEAKRDEYFVYGEYIATRLRNCNRRDSEIQKAKHLLQMVLSYLNAGVYSCTKLTEGNTEVQDDMASIPNTVIDQI